MAGASWILHVDIDEFLAAVEILRRPELRGRPVVVGGSGDPTERRVVVATASYAAREFGVHSGMPLRTAAKRCPDAVFLPVDRPVYEAASAEVMATLRKFCRVEVLGWDEAFLDARSADPDGLAAAIKDAVLQATGLSCAVGIGDNKHRAKLATGFAKPGGVYRLTAENWAAVMFARPTTALWGIGSKMAKNLADIGIVTVADLAAADPRQLAARFGPVKGPRYRALGHGVGETTVVVEQRVARSRSKQKTFPADLTDRAEVADAVVMLAHELADEAARGERVVARVGVTLRFAPFFTQLRTRTLPEPGADSREIERAALVVLDRFDDDRPVRLVGVHVEFV